MSRLGDVIEGVKRAILIEHRVTELATTLKELDARERDTRDRLIRLEGIVAGAQAAKGARRLR